MRVILLLPFLLVLGSPLGLKESTAKESSAKPDVELVAPVKNSDGVLRVLVLHDMEGLSGQDDPRTFFAGYPDFYARGREYLTADVNAVIKGLFEGGADEVHVVDGHGSGNPEPDILLKELDPRARMVFRDKPFRQYMDLVEPGVYDAVAVVGMHAKTGSRGFASHTFTLGIGVELNGHSITETEFVGLSFGRASVPVIFASGDDRLAADLKAMPWITYVLTKTATSASSADTRPVEVVRGELREGATRALRQRDQAKAMRLRMPVQVAVRVVPPASLSVLDGVPGIEYENETVRFTAQSFEEVNGGIMKLIGVARTNYSSVLMESLNARPDGEAIVADYRHRLVNRWLDYESGRWSPPKPEPPKPGQRYHGAN